MADQISERATELLGSAVSYLSALHVHAARHDHLGAGYGCAGCELRDQIAAELRRMADEEQPDAPAPAADQIWQDADPRADGRLLWIERTDATHAVAQQVVLTPGGEPVPLPGVRRTRIRLDRFRPTSTGYRYVGEAQR